MSHLPFPPKLVRLLDSDGALASGAGGRQFVSYRTAGFGGVKVRANVVKTEIHRMRGTIAMPRPARQVLVEVMGLFDFAACR